MFLCDKVVQVIRVPVPNIYLMPAGPAITVKHVTFLEHLGKGMICKWSEFTSQWIKNETICKKPVRI